MLVLLALVGQLKPLVERLVFSLQRFVFLLEFLDKHRLAVLHFLDSLVKLGLNLGDHDLVGSFSLVLAIALRSLQLLHSRLKLSLSVVKVLLGSVSLLLKELKLAFPESLVSIIRVVLVRMESLHLHVLSSPFFNLSLDSLLITRESHVKLLIGVSELGDLNFAVLNKLLLLCL